MAKKAVATLHEGSKEGRSYTKVIKMVKSPKTGAYIFDEQMVRNEDVQNLMKAVKQLTRYANRPVEAALVVDGKTMAKTIVKPMKKEMERIEKINNRLRGER